MKYKVKVKVTKTYFLYCDVDANDTEEAEHLAIEKAEQSKEDCLMKWGDITEYEGLSYVEMFKEE
jgi:hypothetical protein